MNLPADNTSIRVEHIYHFIDKGRLNYNEAIRRKNLLHAQSRAHFFCNAQTPISRPNTSNSYHSNSSRLEAGTPYSIWCIPTLSKTSSLVPPSDIRDIDYVADANLEIVAYHADTMAADSSSVSRDCCEIIGPQMCYECRKNRMRQASNEISDISLPALQPSEKNHTSAAIIKKYLPGLPEPEIENRLARGEIAGPLFRKSFRNLKLSDVENDDNSRLTNKKVTIVKHSKENSRKYISQRKISDLYFTNIRDLNYKIITGNADRNIGFSDIVRNVQNVNRVKLWTKSSYPTFISPRKVKMVQKTNYQSFFEPPLIEKDKQDVEPTFFAGSCGEYVLPEKLPDELVFVNKNGKEVKASTSISFTVRSSASSEGGTNTDHIQTNTDTYKSRGDCRGSVMASSLIEEDSEQDEDKDDEST